MGAKSSGRRSEATARPRATAVEPHTIDRDHPGERLAPGGQVLQGCGLERAVQGPRTGNYRITVGIISPHIELATDGKEPSLAPFSEAIATVLRKACGAAHRAMDKPPGDMSIKDAAWQVMDDCIRIASTDGTLPANARQVMYAARGAILQLDRQGRSLNDHYFTQTLTARLYR